MTHKIVQAASRPLLQKPQGRGTHSVGTGKESRNPGPPVQEPWLNYVMTIKYTEESKPIVDSNRLLTECRARGMVAERLFGEREVALC
ncbi:MAG TPA: hypothetical protein VI386_29490 [Candidatus Sulfotelmatobacter sp.]